MKRSPRCKIPLIALGNDGDLDSSAGSRTSTSVSETCSHGSPLCQDAERKRVLGSYLAGPGSDCSEC
jgi:hypothetical protein